MDFGWFHVFVLVLLLQAAAHEATRPPTDFFAYPLLPKVQFPKIPSLPEPQTLWCNFPTTVYHTTFLTSPLSFVTTTTPTPTPTPILTSSVQLSYFLALRSVSIVLPGDISANQYAVVDSVS
ncbi:hypothetical protein AAHA92_21222 [Salvia divinorum]|uniref:Uncharacterized protein n=1 Tax=Salvia divinorum TaxID=28513 RepID=A0ABD1GJS4_SALDI